MARLRRHSLLWVIGACCLAAVHLTLLAAGETPGFWLGRFDLSELFFNIAVAYFYLWPAVEFRFAAVRGRIMPAVVPLCACAVPLCLGLAVTVGEVRYLLGHWGLYRNDPRWVQVLVLVMAWRGVVSAIILLVCLAVVRREVAKLVAGACERRCAVCGYDLRGSPGPRCPECGEPFVESASPSGTRGRD